jgi:Tol biopolymer transport system component
VQHHSHSRRILPRRSRTLASLLCASLAALAIATGCGKNPTGTGDLSGTHMLAFASDRGHATGQYDLYLFDFDTGGYKELPSTVKSGAAERHPSISSDGRFIAYQVDRGIGTGQDIEILDRFRGVVIDRDSLPGLNTTADETDPVFTGDGLKLCYVQGNNTTRHVRMYDGRTKQIVPLSGIDAPAPFSDYSPAPNRDGSVIAFVTNRAGTPDVMLYSQTRGILDGPKLRACLVSAAEDVDPAWSGGNRYIAFSSDRPGSLGQHDIYLLEFTTTPTTVDTVLVPLPLLNSSSDERHPTLSEAGNILVFQSNNGGGQGRWDMWNYDITHTPAVAPSQVNFENTSYDEIEPSLRWPF